MAIPIVLFLSTACIIITFFYLHFSTRHKERMSLIENGQDAGIFNDQQSNRIGSNSLKYGLFLVLVGFGVIVGMILVEVLRVDEIIILPCVLISGGLALLLYYRIMRREEEELESKSIYSSTKDDIHEVV